MNKVLMVLEFVFGCWHRNLSRPFTLSGWTYEVCLSCGKKFAYNRVEISSRVVPRENLAQKDSNNIGLPAVPPSRDTMLWSEVHYSH